MDKNFGKKNEKLLLNSMTSVEQCKQLLTRLNKQLTRAILTGKINCNSIASNLIEFIVTTQVNFTALQENLVETLVVENTQKVVLELCAVAQVAVDILKRNLFERTADVGFLATDDDIVRFLKKENEEPTAVASIEKRLREYRNKYTVYDEIVILDTHGNVKAHLDSNNPIRSSNDSLIQETLEADEYVETFRQSDLAPGREEVLIYSQSINDPNTRTPLGVLCLLFDFEGEMKGIFSDVQNFSSNEIIMILDESGNAIASSNPTVAPVGKYYKMAVEKDFQVVKIENKFYLSTTQATKGYQDFYGLTWYGHVLKPLEYAFKNDVNDHHLDEKSIRDNALFSDRLIQVEKTSEDILSDLELVVQNGEIMAAKKKCSQNDNAEKIEAMALPFVLAEIKKIGDQFQHIFQDSTGNLLRLVTSSRLHEVQFLAQLAINIMDRNLYERANDCRWWALTSDFRRILEKPDISAADIASMRVILEYINSLYTVYTNLFVYDCRGKILTCSSQVEQHHEGRTLNAGYISATLKITDSQRYCVSPFEPSELYTQHSSSGHTYIYNAPITSLSNPEKVLGGIGIVFDSEPQFKSMLNDTLPRDESGRIVEGSEAMFFTCDGMVVSSTDPEMFPGDHVEIPEKFRRLQAGQSTSMISTEEGKLFAIGCSHSSGYREYKRDGAYSNDLLCVIRVRI